MEHDNSKNHAISSIYSVNWRAEKGNTGKGLLEDVVNCADLVLALDNAGWKSNNGDVIVNWCFYAICGRFAGLMDCPIRVEKMKAVVRCIFDKYFCDKRVHRSCCIINMTHLRIMFIKMLSFVGDISGTVSSKLQANAVGESTDSKAVQFSLALDYYANFILPGRNTADS